MPRASKSSIAPWLDLAAPPAPPTLAGLIRHIVTGHHAYTRSALDRLDRLSAKLVENEQRGNLELLRVRRLLQAIDWNLRPHLMKEEETLFPYIETLDSANRTGRRRPSGSLGGVGHPVRMMLHDHNHVEAMLRELRALTQGYAVPFHASVTWGALYSGLHELERDLFEHMHLETNVLFPRAIELEQEGR
jgi:regulator of cell morphogenesis and NO signaling